MKNLGNIPRELKPRWEAALILASLIITCDVAFGHGMAAGNKYLLYLPVPVLLWAATRFRMLGASTALSVVALLAIRAAVTGRSSAPPPHGYDLLSIQLLLLVLSAPILSLAVLREEQRDTELALRKSEERFRTVLDTAPLMVWMSGRDGLCTFFNKAWVDFTGRPAGEQIGAGWAESVHPDDKRRVVNDYLKSFDDRVEFTLEYRLRRHDGAYRSIVDTGGPQYGGGGEFLGYIGSCADVTEFRTAEEKLRLSERMLRDFSAQTIEIREAERRRIGQELHDDLGQRAAALSIGLSALSRSREPVAERIERLRKQAGELCNDIAVLSHRVHPVMLERLGLRIALQKLCEESNSPGRTAVRFVSHGTSREVAWASLVSVYRVAQEALRNALKHARATRIEMRLNVTRSDVILEIVDDGRGFNPESYTGTGLGIAGMSERMRAVGGSLTIKSVPGLGTTVTASVRDVDSPSSAT